MEQLAKPALEAVNNGEVKFYPDDGLKYNHWPKILKIGISRQLWGHRIPVWYKEEEIYCNKSA